MKLRNLLLTGLSFVLVAAVSIGGTLAYLTSKDDDVNVMTLGKVEIKQHEYQRATNDDGSYKTDTIDGQLSYVLEAFEQGKALLPIVGDPNGGYDPTEVRLAQLGHNSRGGMQVFNVKNAQDKFVVVENTGKNDAYVRTIVAFEAGSLSEQEFDAVVNYSSHFTWKETEDWFVVEIDGNNYYLVEFVYNGYQDIQHPNGVLKPGDYTYNSLAQVYMYNTATNEDCEALDGNKNGTFDILVISQAVQVEGFADAKTALDTGFGEFNEENVAQWFGGTIIPLITADTDDIDDILAEGGEILLDGNVGGEGYTPAVSAGSTVSVDMKGNTVDADYFNNSGNLTLENGTLEAGTTNDYGLITRAGSNTVLNDVDFKSAGGGLGATDGSYVEINGGLIDVSTASTSGRYNVYAVGEGTKVVINDGIFSFSKTLNQKRAYIYAGAGATVIVNGGTFGPASTRDGYTAGILGDGTVIITGGTFGFNPSAWVADGYEAVKDGSTWTVVAK